MDTKQLEKETCCKFVGVASDLGVGSCPSCNQDLPDNAAIFDISQRLDKPKREDRIYQQYAIMLGKKFLCYRCAIFYIRPVLFSKLLGKDTRIKLRD